MEAMACGLPIVTTPVFGIPEIVRENVNALFYEPGDVRSLASAIEELWRNVRLREELASNSPIVAAGQPGFSNMVEQYGRIIRQAVNLRL
jgi:glycosyltransferase involved in cell wall biosynthesis